MITPKPSWIVQVNAHLMSLRLITPAKPYLLPNSCTGSERQPHHQLGKPRLFCVRLNFSSLQGFPKHQGYALVPSSPPWSPMQSLCCSRKYPGM